MITAFQQATEKASITVDTEELQRAVASVGSIVGEEADMVLDLKDGQFTIKSETATNEAETILMLEFFSGDSSVKVHSKYFGSLFTNIPTGKATIKFMESCLLLQSEDKSVSYVCAYRGS